LRYVFVVILRISFNGDFQVIDVDCIEPRDLDLEIKLHIHQVLEFFVQHITIPIRELRQSVLREDECTLLSVAKMVKTDCRNSGLA
jgi:hypothetical protein